MSPWILFQILLILKIILLAVLSILSILSINCFIKRITNPVEAPVKINVHARITN